MLKIVKVREYMSADLVCLAPDTEVAKAIDLLVRHKISGAPVIDSEKRLVGMLSEGDCLKALFADCYYEERGATVASVMSQVTDVIDVEADIIKAAEMFIAKGRRRLPVMEGGRLVGQISRRDILRAVQVYNHQGAPR
jgi:CBS domain-containing protein